MHVPGKARVGDRSVLAGALVITGMSVACGGRSQLDDPTTEMPWVRTPLSPTTASFFNSVAADASGNVYAAGNLWGPGTLDFGYGVTATGVFNGYNVLLVKYNSSGTAQWRQTSTAQPGQAVSAGSSGSQFYSVAVDSSDNVYAAGRTSGASGPVDFGNGVTVIGSDTFSSAVLVKYGSSGAAQWAQAVTGGLSESIFSSVAVDSSGNVYTAGEIEGTGTYVFGKNVTTTGKAISEGMGSMAFNAVLAKYDSSGVAQWAHTVTAGSIGSRFSSVTVDSAGDVYAAGSISGTATYDFGSGVTATGTASLSRFTGPEIPNVILVKYNSSGIAQWAQTDTAGHRSAFSSVAVDSAGNVYAAGSLGGPEAFDFGNGVTAMGALTRGAIDGFDGPLYVVLVKYNSSGIAQWARTVTNAGPSSSFDSVALDSSGNAYAAGSLYGPATFDFGTGATASTTQGTPCVVLVKYNSSGIAQSARSSVSGDSGYAVYTSVAVDSWDNAFAAGGIASTGGTGTVDFGNNVTAIGTEVPYPSSSALLVKYQ